MPVGSRGMSAGFGAGGLTAKAHLAEVTSWAPARVASCVTWKWAPCRALFSRLWRGNDGAACSTGCEASVSWHMHVPPNSPVCQVRTLQVVTKK